ncbi:hypothetical protein HK098_003763 [Nowakowskiella sp. JEL0407]|nr:hypothetical protein HK098_003763 [Nowakowskiella sp. JEL0407]
MTQSSSLLYSSLQYPIHLDPSTELKMISVDDTYYYETQQQHRRMDLPTPLLPSFTAFTYSPPQLQNGFSSVPPTPTKTYPQYIPVAYTPLTPDGSPESNFSYPESSSYLDQNFAATYQVPVQLPELGQPYISFSTSPGINYADGGELLTPIELNHPTYHPVRSNSLPYAVTLSETVNFDHSNVQMLPQSLLPPLPDDQQVQQSSSPPVETQGMMGTSSKLGAVKKPSNRKSKKISSVAAVRAAGSIKSSAQGYLCPLLAEGLCTHSKPFNRVYNLRVHINSHSPERSRKFECEVCGRCYFRINELRRHRKRKHA